MNAFASENEWELVHVKHTLQNDGSSCGPLVCQVKLYTIIFTEDFYPFLFAKFFLKWSNEVVKSETIQLAETEYEKRHLRSQISASLFSAAGKQPSLKKKSSSTISFRASWNLLYFLFLWYWWWRS